MDHFLTSAILSYLVQKPEVTLLGHAARQLQDESAFAQHGGPALVYDTHHEVVEGAPVLVSHKQHHVAREEALVLLPSDMLVARRVEPHLYTRLKRKLLFPLVPHKLNPNGRQFGTHHRQKPSVHNPNTHFLSIHA